MNLNWIIYGTPPWGKLGRYFLEYEHVKRHMHKVVNNLSHME
jgi:hypothetical protein